MREINVSNVVVLIDPHTLKAVESITYDSLAKHVTVITDIRELGDAHYGCEFIFFEPAVPAVVTAEILQEMVELYAIKSHLVYTMQAVSDVFVSGVKKVRASYRILEWNLVYAVLMDDAAILEPYQRTKTEPIEFAALLENLPPEYSGPVNRMYQSYLSLASSLSKLVADNAVLNEQVQAYAAVGRKTTRAIEELRSLLETMTKQNRRYCAMLSESYDTTVTGLYTERPRVLYIKTVSHLAGIDNLIMLLYSVLTKQYKTSCKVIKIVDSSNTIGLNYVPNVYLPLTDTYSTYDVLKGDFLMTLGAYNILFNLLMLNRSGLDFLIVHDIRGQESLALDAALIDLSLYEMSGDYAVLGEYDNILSDIEDKVPFYWSFKDTMRYTGTNSVKLSNHPTIAKILDHLL